MRARRWGIGLAVGWIMLGAGMAAEAHMRDYLLTQPYFTAGKGEFEVELHNDFNFVEADDDDTYASKHQVELEYGITDHIQLGYYEVYTWDREKDWERDAFKIELKGRFAQAGQWPVDVALYTEYKNPDGHRDIRSDVLENKLILSKDFGRVNVAGNFVFEKELNSGEPWEFEYTAGVSYAVTPTTRIGLEIQESLGDSGEFLQQLEEREILLVPGIYANITPHVRVLAGPAFGLTRGSDDFQLRSIVEVEF